MNIISLDWTQRKRVWHECKFDSIVLFSLFCFIASIYKESSFVSCSSFFQEFEKKVIRNLLHILFIRSVGFEGFNFCLLFIRRAFTLRQLHAWGKSLYKNTHQINTRSVICYWRVEWSFESRWKNSHEGDMMMLMASKTTKTQEFQSSSHAPTHIY